MEEPEFRERAEAMCDALVSGDIGLATADFSPELQRNLGEVLSLLPLPAIAATVDSIERGGGSGFTVTLRLTGENEEVVIQTRWKDRDGHATVVEASHLSRVEMAPPSDGETGDGDDAGSADGTSG
jgi:hypothetical protein